MRFAVVALVCWCSTVLILTTSTAEYVAIGGLGVGVIAGSYALARKESGATALVAVAGVFAGLIALSALVSSPTRQPDTLTEAANRGQSMELVVQYTGLPQRRGDRDGYHTRIRIESLNKQSVSVPAMLFTDGGTPPVLGSMATLQAEAIVNGPAERASALVFADTAPRTIRAAPWYLSWASSLRHDFVDLCADIPGPGAQLLPGLAVGDVSSVSSDLEDEMKATSLSHLTAVSGSNCALIIVATMIVTGWLGLAVLPMEVVGCGA